MLRQVSNSFHSAPFLTLVVDETTDVSNQYQAVVCLQWADNSLEAREDFVGMYETESTVLKPESYTPWYVLCRLDISVR